jgi:hypothetical protein
MIVSYQISKRHSNAMETGYQAHRVAALIYLANNLLECHALSTSLRSKAREFGRM